ncbi:class I SAM-dependent methyltransferase [Nocardioides sp. SYSU D00038]|uniref:class I SAM-dependent methyltransferase n=1 Tax=Nocardioides sp. SYSU D00038 TaxID=2812554 RepID=UPI001967CF19|nr:methyltransferase domain-containing protein [Nocardioides sp. SYSU D00038]
MDRTTLAFLGAALRHPGRVGAVAPSSSALTAVLAGVVPTTGTPTVVELGPGTGAVSTAIVERLPAGARHLAVEIDPRMVEALRRSQPQLEVIEGDARDLVRLLGERDVTRVDAVVSGLPWALFDGGTQRAILAAARQLLGGTGAFTTFAYLHALRFPAARRFRGLLGEVFDEVEVTEPVWRNLPPALCYVCR